MSEIAPEERAYLDALADAVEMGANGDEAVRYADSMRGSVWFQGRALHYASADFVAVLRQTPPGRLVDHIASLLARRLDDEKPPPPRGRWGQ